MLISKTTFQEYLFCPKNIWLKLHKPELLDKYKLSEYELHLVEQGNEVESVARGQFPGGVLVSETGERAVTETIQLMAEKVPAIFQATFIEDDFIVRNDVLIYDKAHDRWNLCEIKATNSIKEGSKERDHIVDIAFQASVLRRAGVPIGKYLHMRLNKEYVRMGDLDIQALFVIEDVTNEVTSRIPEVEEKMETARYYLNQEKEPASGCDCVYTSRRNHCATFPYSNPHIPEYAVHDIAYVSKKKLEDFMDQHVYSLDDIEDPDAFKLTDKQKVQVLAHRLGNPMIDTDVIAKELNNLAFPLYFLDYEAYGPAIPAFNGYRPYMHIPFQFSLHILREPNATLEHVEYLHTELSDPSEPIAQLLKEHIIGGTTVSWYKPYEMRINREISERLPEYRDFFERVNASMYDLRDIFIAQHYVHKDFKGKTSIKKVLPVLAPELKYTNLEIQEGATASKLWWEMVAPNADEVTRKATEENLKKYCGLDTYAMVAIWKHLISL